MIVYLNMTSFPTLITLRLYYRHKKSRGGVKRKKRSLVSVGNLASQDAQIDISFCTLFMGNISFNFMQTEENGKYTLNLIQTTTNTTNTSTTTAPLIPPNTTDDHAILDELDVTRLAHLASRDIDAIVDNRTDDDDQPDLDTDDSFAGGGGGGEKMHEQPAAAVDSTSIIMEGFTTEATDITTPVEMRLTTTAVASCSLLAEADTSAQVSDFSEFPKGTVSETGGGGGKNKCETMFDITDPEEDASDMEETMDKVRMDEAVEPEQKQEEVMESEATLVPPEAQSTNSNNINAVDEVNFRIRKREDQIDKSFNRLSSEVVSEIEAFKDDEYMKVSLQLSEQDEQEAETDFDKLVEDSFKEDKSEDWVSNDDSSPAKEEAPPLPSTTFKPQGDLD